MYPLFRLESFFHHLALCAFILSGLALAHSPILLTTHALHVEFIPLPFLLPFLTPKASTDFTSLQTPQRFSVGGIHTLGTLFLAPYSLLTLLEHSLQS